MPVMKKKNFLSNKDFTKPGTDVEIKAGYHDDSETVLKELL
jgi:hypothetical protein